jgi:hypothetical protein
MQVWHAETCVYLPVLARVLSASPVQQSQIQEVVSQLVVARALPGAHVSHLTVTHDGHDAETVLGVLKQLEQHGFAAKDHSDDDSSSWRLTAAGMTELRLCQRLSSPHAVLVPRLGEVDVHKRTAFELLYDLVEKHGWHVEVAGSNSKVKRLPYQWSSAADVPSMKCIWVRKSKPCLSQSYLLAVHQGHKHKQVVKHFQTDAWYKKLLSGATGPTRAGRGRAPKKSNGDFQFVDEDQWGTLPLLPPAKRRRQPKTIFDDVVSEGGEGSEGKGSEPNESILSHSDASSDSASSSSSASSTSSSSSSTSSSSSPSSASSDVSSQRATPGVGRPAASACQVDLSGMPAELVTHLWRGLKFTPRWADGRHSGWEVTCYRSDHADGRFCRRTVYFPKGHDGDSDEAKEMVVRRLRWWGLAGLSPDCNSRNSHKACPHKGPGNSVANLPTLAQLVTWSACPA